MSWRRPSSWRLAAMVAVATATVTLVAPLGSGCGLQSSGDEAARWIEQASAVNGEADRAIAKGDPDAARRALVTLVEGPVAVTVAPAHRRAVLMDAYFRLAEIELGRGQAQAARDLAGRGLALGEAQDLFTANLLIAQGRALEGVGADRDASMSYHRALVVSEALLHEALGDRSSGGGQ